MRDLESIIVDLQSCMSKDTSIADHFKEIHLLMEKSDYRKLSSSIKAGLSQFQSSSNTLFEASHAKRYADLLSELHDHFSPSTPENEKSRLIKLIFAINANNLAAVHEALNMGSTIVINNKTAFGELPLSAALKTKNMDIIRLLLNKGAVITGVAHINKSVTPKRSTLLHIACELGLNDIVLDLLDDGANVNSKNSYDITPLYMAIEHRNFVTANLLLDKNADPNIICDVKNGFHNAFILAINKGEYQLAEKMIEKNYKIRNADFEYVYKLRNGNPDAEALYKKMKRSLADKKKSIMHESQRYQDNILSQSSPSKYYETFVSHIYMSNEEQKRSLLTNLIQLEQDENPILKPLLDTMQLAMRGYRNPDNPPMTQRPLKVIISEEMTTHSLTAVENTEGFYRNNTVFVAAGMGNMLGSLLHEIKHFIDNEIYGDTSVPEEQQDHFFAVKEIFKNSIENMPNETLEERQIVASIESIFKNYSGPDQDAEILVKVPEIIGYLGMEKGYAWLQKNAPELLDFYVNKFNPICEQYNEAMHMTENISTPEKKAGI